MDQYEGINENILNNYLKALKYDERIISNIKERVKEKGDVFVDKALEQNKKVLVHSSNVYESMLDHNENSNNELANLESLLEDIIEKSKKAAKSKGNRKGDSGSLSVEGIYEATLKEFENKIDEMNSHNKANDEKIVKEKKVILETSDKLKEVNDYINKFLVEKRLYLDKVDEQKMRDLTFAKKLPRTYQTQVMKIVFESILLEKIQEKIDEKLSSGEIDKESNEYEKQKEAFEISITYDNYKKFCYNSWRFKNQILAAEEFVIHEFQKDGKEVMTLEKFAITMNGLKKEAEKYKDENAEKIFWPLINSILVVIYSTIARKRKATYEENIEKSNKKIEGFEAEKNDNKGKINLLEEMKRKILKNSSIQKPSQKVNIEREDSLEEVDGGELKKELDGLKDESQRIMEELKRIKNEQENEFYVYLKNIAKVLLHQKNMNVI
jgi:hypothetical protein